MYEHLDDILRVGRKIVDATSELSLGSTTPQRIYSFCLHARIVDLSSAIAALLKSHDVAGIPHLVRGQLEAFADLRNLLADAGYARRMAAAVFEQHAKVLKAVASGRANTSAIPNAAQLLQAAETELARFRAAGDAPLNVADRFNRAQLLGEYYSVYAYLCQHSHNNLTALESRHVNKTVEPYQLRVGLDEIDAEMSVLVDLSLKMPIDSLRMLTADETGPIADAVEEVRKDFEEVRKNWLPSPSVRTAGKREAET